MENQTQPKRWCDPGAGGQIDRMFYGHMFRGSNYPLTLGGTPELVLCLADVQVLTHPVRAADHVENLNCVGLNKKKWGTAFCGGMRSLTKHDFNLLTAAPADRPIG